MRLDQFMAYFEKNHRVTLETCRLLPPEHWHWKPIESLYTAGQLLCHIAYSQRAMTEWVARATFEWRFEEATRPIDSLEKGLIYLEECHAYAVELYGTLSEAHFQETLKTPFGFEATRWQLAEGMIDHETHHRGQLHTYLRLLGVEGKALAPIFHHVCFLKVGLA
jgi:uncharacterized damage-inducible protein DinB